LWRRVVDEVHREYSDVELNHFYVDNCAMQIIKNPGQFDIILTNNMFGDILSDESAMITGSIGMLPSASFGGKIGLYEPVHGSAPDIAGKNIANPCGIILSLALLFRYSLNEPTIADAIEEAIKKVLEKGYRTVDIAKEGSNILSTSAMGNCIKNELEEIFAGTRSRLQSKI
ncbi:MAG: isocitrate/isopropylmalate family dehydrogenase, partial [candidate division WOR-3 bacterium]|nr:isocitrate/isopropylmalate family dehydrogenase [candidate division WOR-3 bacterium]